MAIVIVRAPALLTALPLLASLCLPLAGCYGDVETFAKRGAKHWCHRLEECYRASFDDLYDGDMDRCRDEVEENLLEFDHGQADRGCEYEPDDAKRCVQTARDVHDDCSDAADQLMTDHCYGDPLSAIVFAPSEVYHCSAPLEPEPEPGALASWPDQAPAGAPAP